MELENIVTLIKAVSESDVTGFKYDGELYEYSWDKYADNVEGDSVQYKIKDELVFRLLTYGK